MPKRPILVYEEIHKRAGEGRNEPRCREVMNIETLGDREDRAAGKQRDRGNGEKLQAFDERVAAGAEGPNSIEDIVRDAADHEPDREVGEPGERGRFFERVRDEEVYDRAGGSDDSELYKLPYPASTQPSTNRRRAR